MHIYIPTRGRIGHQYTLKAIPKSWLQFVTVVCPEYEVVHHRKFGVRTAPFNTVGISPKRQFIMELAHKHGQNKILMLDDDLIFYYRGPKREAGSKTPFSLYLSKNEDISTMLLRVAEGLTDYAHVGVDCREGCQNHEAGAECIRIARALGYRVDVLMRHKIRFDALACMQDFDVNLSLLQLGYPTKVIPHYVQNQARSSNADGGCSTYRTEDVKAACAKGLAERHAPFVTVVPKKNTWKGMEKMVDCRIAWKSAYEWGKLSHGSKYPLF